jgi:hypothetical protein
VTVTTEEALNCEKVTRQQANSKQWFNFRVGRATTSRAKRVCRSSPENPSKRLIKEICYPNSETFFAKQIKWGCDHEKMAKVRVIVHSHLEDSQPYHLFLHFFASKEILFQSVYPHNTLPSGLAPKYGNVGLIRNPLSCH